MQKAKVNVLFVQFAYGGNGGIRSVAAEIRRWFAQVYYQMRQDERIDRIEDITAGDIPLTMERNKVVKYAKAAGIDFIWMLDSDNIPDLHITEPGSKGFWSSSFNFAYDRYVRGIPSVVCAPYCGPPPDPRTGGIENVYVFKWETRANDEANPYFGLESFTRDEAAKMAGIQPIDAGPTGCALYTIDAFDLLDVRPTRKEDILEEFQRGERGVTETLRLLNRQSWFYYEYPDQEQAQKASTEDVTNTRDISMAGYLKYRQPTVFCNWDAWAGHVKPKVVGKPRAICANQISECFRQAAERNVDSRERLVEVDFTQPDDLEKAPLVSIGNAVEAQTPLEPEQKLLGEFPIGKRSVAGRVVKSVGFRTPELELETLTHLVAVMAKRHPDRPLRVIEIGSWVGESAIALQAGFGPAGGEVYCIDTFEGSDTDQSRPIAEAYGGKEAIKAQFRENVGELLETSIRMIEGESYDQSQIMDPQGADIIFIDAGHDYESAQRDILTWMPHLASTGIMLGHDNAPQWPGVQRAVRELFDSIDCTVRNFSSIWMVGKQEYTDALNKNGGCSHREEEPKPQDA